MRSNRSAGVAFFLLLVGGELRANPPQDFNNSLAIQQAMAKAKDYKTQPDHKKMVEVLEEQLARINGDSAFLELLRDAYRGYIRDLWLADQGSLAKKYLERLTIIEPSAAKDPILSGGNQPIDKQSAPAKTLDKNPTPPSVAASSDRPITFRAKADDPFDANNKRPAGNLQAKQFLAKAEEEFSRRRFVEARTFYERAHQADPLAVDPCRDRWAYCMLNHVVDQLNKPAHTSDSLVDLQKQVNGAVSLAPALGDTGKWLLREIDQRSRTAQPSSAQPASTSRDNGPEPSINIQHTGGAQGWQIAETANFRIFHNQSRDYAERVAQVAERTRRDMFRKWFGTDGPAWTYKCDLFLHATATDYSRQTGVPSNSPGHSRIETDPTGQRVIGRRMDMHSDVAGMMETVLPHETTHVVLAGMFGAFAVPRWADEGMAVLTESTEKIEQHRRNLVKSPKELLFGVRELMQLGDYPPPRRISAFYAQSVCLVEFMTKERGALVFSEFLRDGLREGYEPSLRRYFNWSWSDLETRWSQHISETTHLAQGR